MLPSKVFLPTANPEHAAIIGIATAVMAFSSQSTAGGSAYFTSKLALIKLMEYLAAENPKVFTAAIQPGMHETDCFRKSLADPKLLPMDKSKFLHSPPPCSFFLNSY